MDPQLLTLQGQHFQILQCHVHEVLVQVLQLRCILSKFFLTILFLEKNMVEVTSTVARNIFERKET